MGPRMMAAAITGSYDSGFATNRWPIERTWRVHTETGLHEDLTTQDLVGKPVCCLLGAAGIGKTFELRLLESLERESGVEVRFVRLAEIASSADRMAQKLEALVSNVGSQLAIYVDAVDEAMIPVSTAAQVLAEWIRDKLRDIRPLLRISCRSTIWPRIVQSAIDDSYGAGTPLVATLNRLSASDVLKVAEHVGVDGMSFLEQVDASGVVLLSEQPLTLRMLFRVFQKQGCLPNNRGALFSQAVNVLSQERDERRELGNVSEISPPVILEAAERLACFTLLSGFERIDLGDDPPDLSLGWLDLSSLPSSGRSLDERLLRAIGCCALCEGDGARCFRFIHRQIAEYLAGRRIAKLLLHQSRALLCSGLGWRAGVAGPLREASAFAAIESRELAQWVAETDPEVIGLSDVADDILRRLALLQLMERFRKRAMTDTLLVGDELRFTGFRYSGVENDLRPVLKERGDGSEDILELVIDLVQNWRLESLHPQGLRITIANPG